MVLMPPDVMVVTPAVVAMAPVMVMVELGEVEQPRLARQKGAGPRGR